ncbi:hypothetical protein JHN53_22995 [Streptomyces sp. MBT58]|uniref:hypothetical protein n=1 Tax=Streptomyces sp. MBT58 TaxID=1488389 RepID=UPI001912FE35|nr:hypothetical protein [Streptomyces sp. MBT58]MBK5994461.1 hypothetical protein [Streptomyces sp. MBT58]
MEPLTKEQLLSRYPTDEIRDRIFRLSMLSDILSECLIANNYKTPSYLHEAVKLTQYGNERVQAFARKRIPIPEARIICFLEFSWIELLVDVEATDIASVEAAISRQIKDRSIYFPFNFGHTLYDRAYDELRDKDDLHSLDLSDTLKFLDGTPQGVFQMHEYVTGPFGLLTSKQMRIFQPVQSSKIYHCSDMNCRDIHSVRFSTGMDAPVNKHRSEAMKVLYKDNQIPSAWGSFISQIFSDTMRPARDQIGDTLIPILGDCLTDDEISHLTRWLLDNTRGALREICNSLGLRGSAEHIVAGHQRAELMQLCLTMSDREIMQGIDALVHGDVISVPNSEVRQPPINLSAFGDFRLVAEIGSLGVRIRSTNHNLAPLRLRNLVESMYRLDDVADREELEWQLRAAVGTSLEARLENYLQNQSPRSVLERLVLARKSNAVAACEILNLREGAAESDDFISLILWKLGFASKATGDPHSDFWRLHEDMERMARMGPGGALSPSVEDFRGIAANYFVALENALDDSAAFLIWALTHDHFTDSRPFVYQKEDQRDKSFAWLQDSVDKSRTPDQELQYGSRNNLYALCRAFQCVATELKRMSENRETHRRAVADYPDWVEQQNLQKFPFRHVVPFLDLTDDSREVLLTRLNEISRLLVSEKAYTARNDWLHGGNKDLDFAKARISLSGIRNAVQLIEDCGFVRTVFATSEHKSDGYGRSVNRMVNTRGVVLEVHEPSPFAWTKLPSIGKGVHIMTAACFSAPNEFLRFVSESNSAFTEMWAEFPKRRPRSQRAGHALDNVSTGIPGQVTGPQGASVDHPRDA